jgi:hypothetical protein
VTRRSGGIFLSYRRQDQHVAGRIADGLIMRFGRERVFLDVENIEPGADFIAAITDAVSRCAVLIAVIGPQWVTMKDRTGQRRKLDDPQDFVVLEIKTALERGIRVIPVLVDDAVMPLAEELPESLRDLLRRQAVEVEHAGFHSDLQRVLAAIDAVLRSATPIPDRARLPEPSIPRPSPATPRPAPAPAPTTSTPLAPAPRRAGERIDGPTEAMRTVRPAESSEREAPPGPPSASRTAVPPARVAARVLLWWWIYAWSVFAASGVGLAIANPPRYPVGSTIATEAFLAILIAAGAWLLRRELAAQRILLNDVTPGRVRASATRGTNTKHVRLVAFICSGVSVVFLVAMAMSPPSP